MKAMGEHLITLFYYILRAYIYIGFIYHPVLVTRVATHFQSAADRRKRNVDPLDIHTRASGNVA